MGQHQDLQVSARSEAALRGWLDELPALAPAIDKDAAVRVLLLSDAATAGSTLLQAAKTGHPVVLGHANLSLAALDLALAYDGDDRSRRITRAVEHAEAAVEIAERAVAPAVRVELMPRAAALLAGCLPLMPKAKAAGMERRITQLAGAVGAALTEQATEARRGVACLAAAMTLGNGAKLVRQASAKAAVLERALGLAEEARIALARAGEVSKAEVAAEVADGLEARLPH
jgi:hypothetical protein